MDKPPKLAPALKQFLAVRIKRHAIAGHDPTDPQWIIDTIQEFLNENDAALTANAVRRFKR